jgi:hypothetical protein
LSTAYGRSISAMTGRSFTSALQRLDLEQNAGIGRSNRRVVENELLLVAEVD